MSHTREEVEQVVVRFAGDSGDGVQVMGELFTSASAISGQDVATLPDYPAEIRAPAGTLSGVSGYQICVGANKVYTPGDQVDVVLALNPPALRANLPKTKKNGLLIINEDAFTQKNCEKAGFPANPLADEELKRDFRFIRIPISTLTREALSGTTLSLKQVDRCKNFFALGVMYQLFDLPKDYTINWLKKKFQKKPEVMDANLKVFEAGYQIATSPDVCPVSYKVTAKTRRTIRPGTYRSVSGNVATALGLIAAAKRAGLQLFLGSYPITPASEILHELSNHPRLATVFQAEDEIAGIGTAVGASFGGALAATSTSGPGLSLKTEFIDLAVMAELPLVIVDVQRAGPSTGLPTKTEQSDLLQAIWGRHGDSPLVVLAATSPADCFDKAIEAARLALRYMTPVILLTDGYLANGTEVWRVPSLEELPKIETNRRTDPENFLPYDRNPETLARPWAVPGTPGLEHRLGGLEKEDRTGIMSHNPQNHEKMVHLRAEKIERVADAIPLPEVLGPKDADLLVVGWGSTYGVIRQTIEKLNREKVPVAAVHLTHMNPLPRGLEKLLRSFKKVVIVENNLNQLWYHLRGKYLLQAERFNKIQGLPFEASEIEDKIRELLRA